MSIFSVYLSVYFKYSILLSLGEASETLGVRVLQATSSTEVRVQQLQGTLLEVGGRSEIKPYEI